MKSQQNIESMFKSINKKNKQKKTKSDNNTDNHDDDDNMLNFKSWSKRHIKSSSSSSTKSFSFCNRPLITLHESDEKTESFDPNKKKKINRKRKFDQITSPKLMQQEMNQNKKRMKCLSISPSLFTSFEEDQTPMRSNQRLTQFRRQRVLNPIDSFQSQSSQSVPSSSSKSSVCSVKQSKKRQRRRKKKIIIECEEDIDGMINIDPRRLSLDEHPLMLKKSANKCTNLLYSDTVHSDSSNPPSSNNQKLSTLLDDILNHQNNEKEEINYFDDDLDDNALMMALNDIDQNAHSQCQNMGSIDIADMKIDKSKQKFYRFEVCEIFVDERLRHKILRVSDDWTVELREDWFGTKVSVSDIIHVIGDSVAVMRQFFVQSEGNCDYPNYLKPNENIPIIIETETDFIIDNEHNLLIHFPDCLMIPSRIASSYPCIRTQVISDNVRFYEQSEAMLYGTMCHELFQTMLQQKKGNFKVYDEIKRIISKYLIPLYSINESEQSAMEKISQFIPNMDIFYKLYMCNNANMSDVGWKSHNAKLQINEIVDIEENIWSPMFGIKGKIDASVLTKIEMENGRIMDKLLPFELKTGKESAESTQSARAQLIMYALMMADRYDTHTQICDDFGGGLLYYLKSGHLMGVPLPRGEMRALIMRRNELAYFQNCHPWPNKDKGKKDEIVQKEFPKIISNKRKCAYCFQKKECFIFHKAQCQNRGISDVNVSANDVTTTPMYNELTAHLDEVSLRYINKWIECIDFEETYCFGQNTRHQMWSMSAIKRQEESGKCLANMMQKNVEMNACGKYIYTFEKEQKCEIKKYDLKFGVGDYVIISSQNQNNAKYALGNGIITELNEYFVNFASYKSIKKIGQNIEKYRIDFDDSAYGFSALRANIFYFFLNDCERTKHKRRLLVDLTQPRFDKECKIEIPSHLISAFDALNIDQQNAIYHALKCRDYALILGMPGSGKSSTIIFLLRLLVHCGFKILLCAFTNCAIDHLCIKMLQHSEIKNKFVRIGSLLSINDKLRPFTLDKNENKFDDMKSIDLWLQNKQIFAVTAISSASHCLFSGDKLAKFDYCIVDEAGQLTEPQSLAPLRKCEKFIFVGDNNQLPPLVQCKEARKRGMSRSLFEKLTQKHGEIAVKKLTIQYRMNSDILLLSNCLIYDGAMKCASDSVAKQQLILDKFDKDGINKKWLQNAIHPNKKVILLNTDNLFLSETKNEKKKKRKNVNEFEANMIGQITDCLFECGLKCEQMGVIAPYRSQLKLIESKLTETNKVSLDTIDRFQGSDRDVVIMSFTHTPFDEKLGSILNDWRRINVALTRAKCKLILIASKTALQNSKSALLKKMIKILTKQQWIFDVDAI